MSRATAAAAGWLSADFNPPHDFKAIHDLQPKNAARSFRRMGSFPAVRNYGIAAPLTPQNAVVIHVDAKTRGTPFPHLLIRMFVSGRAVLSP